jgi:hypothetical protein
MTADFSDSEILNTLVRMVVPMRREFGRQLDVRQFLRDGAYAQEVLGVALGSRDPRLAEYARYVERRLHGARVADSTPTIPGVAAPQAASLGPPTAAAPQAAPAPPAAPPAAESDAEAALRQRVMSKYTGGLR